MRPETVDALNRINRRFYRQQGEAFGHTREHPWPGWARVLQAWEDRRPSPPPARRTSILDAGCGNGRGGVFAARELSMPFHYLGLDSSSTLLTAARRHLTDAGVACDLQAADLVTEPLPPDLPGSPFDLITAYGVLHHVPSEARRRSLVAELASRLAPGGLLAVTFWQFADEERFQRRLIPWEVHNLTADQPVDVDDLEPGDHLLAWGDQTPEGGPPQPRRYCHHTSPDEIDALVSIPGLEVVDAFAADGATGKLNQYRLLALSRQGSTMGRSEVGAGRQQALLPEVLVDRLARDLVAQRRRMAVGRAQRQR